MADQRHNMAKAESAGYGLQLEYDNITVESLDWALKEVLENSRYSLCVTFCKLYSQPVT